MSDDETDRALFEGAVNYGALLALLVEKGVIEEADIPGRLETLKVIVRAELDQQMAEREQA